MPRRESAGLRAAPLAMLAGLWLTGCASTAVPPDPPTGASPPDVSTETDIPPPDDAPVPADTPSQEEPRFTLMAESVPVQELLYSLARDAELQIDISGPLEGHITLNAVDEPLSRLLDRIALQVPIRHQRQDDHLHIRPDTPYVRTHAVAYIDLRRSGSSGMDAAMQVGGAEAVQPRRSDPAPGASDSRTELRNESEHRFWQRLEENLVDLVDPDAQDVRAGAGDPRHPDVIINSEAGLVTVRTTHTHHQEVERYLARVLDAAKRQVLIEATVIEVRLDDRHQAGVDWSLVTDGSSGFSFIQNLSGTAFGAALELPHPPGSGEAAGRFAYGSAQGRHGDFRAMLQLLDTFGDVQVMSTPRVNALHNQPAMLKVVDNRVYFTVDVQRTLSDGVIERVFETRVNTVPVGLVLAVVPHIDANGDVLMNVRPTVSRILGFVADPNPELAEAGIDNRIPEIQVRELESMLRVRSGQTAILGGLMQDLVDTQERRVPLLGSLPLIGGLFRYRDEQVRKSELIVLLRPTIAESTDPLRTSDRHLAPLR